MRPREIDSNRIRRVVVRGPNWLGDAVMAVPALRELRRRLPNAHITLSIRPAVAGLFSGVDFIDDLLLYNRRGRGIRAVTRQAREWRHRHFDLAVLFQNAFEAALIAFAAGATSRVGYATDGRRFLLTHPVAKPEWLGKRHEVFNYLNIVAEATRACGIADVPYDAAPSCILDVSDLGREQARELLARQGVPAGEAIVALCPGSTNSRAKRWPADRYAELGDRLQRESGVQVILIGGREDRPISDEVARGMSRPPLVLTGRTELSELMGVLAMSDLLITNDTGPAHVAAAVGCPVLVVFGPTNPVTTRPFSETAEVIRLPPLCAPCMLRDCPIDHRCMTAIDPGVVYMHAIRLLRDRTRVPAGVLA